MSTAAELYISNYSAFCRLGCSEPERRVPQEIRVSILIKLEHRPGACLSDQLKETTCYAEVCQDILRVASSGEFCTVERLAQSLELELRKRVPAKSQCEIEIHKIRPPVQGLEGGVKFRIGFSAC